MKGTLSSHTINQLIIADGYSIEELYQLQEYREASVINSCSRESTEIEMIIAMMLKDAWIGINEMQHSSSTKQKYRFTVCSRGKESC